MPTRRGIQQTKKNNPIPSAKSRSGLAIHKEDEPGEWYRCISCSTKSLEGPH
jgi:hypothetical protein